MDERPNYYAILPANVRYDKNLQFSEKILYAEITSLTLKNGECWASNNYFANLYGVTPQSISKWVNNLYKNGYLFIDYQYKEGTKEIEKRIIKIATESSGGGINHRLRGYQPQIKGYQPQIKEKKETISNININNTIIVNEVIDYMNSLAGTSFKKTTEKTKSLINARLKEGFTLEELKDVVYYKYHTWYKTPKKFSNGVSSDTYYRPNTLFGTNFEEYLEEYKKRTK